jgi:hypothetical protein
MLPCLGVSDFGDPNRDARYLVVPTTTSVRPRQLLRNDGSTWWVTDQLANQSSVVCTFGGVFHGSALIAGSMTSAYSSEFADWIFAAFRKQLSAFGRPRKGYYLDTFAREWMADGKRMCIDVRSPASSDFRV